MKKTTIEKLPHQWRDEYEARGIRGPKNLSELCERCGAIRGAGDKMSRSGDFCKMDLVYFVVEKYEGEERGPVAVFTDGGGGDNLTVYAHLGQHSTACRSWARGCREATADEYADLLAELKRIGYNPQVITRAQWMEKTKILI